MFPDYYASTSSFLSCSPPVLPPDPFWSGWDAEGEQLVEGAAENAWDPLADAGLQEPSLRARVGFAQAVEDTPTTPEGIADRKAQRRQEVEAIRHRDLVATWEALQALPLGETERKLAQALVAAAMGLNRFPLVGVSNRSRNFPRLGAIEISFFCRKPF